MMIRKNWILWEQSAASLEVKLISLENFSSKSGGKRTFHTCEILPLARLTSLESLSKHG